MVNALARFFVTYTMRVCMLLLGAGLALAQTNGAGASFDAASIKPSAVLHGKGGGNFSTPGTLNVRNFSLKDLIEIAYAGNSRLLDSYQVVGGTNWLDDAAFDVIGKAGTKATWPELQQMLQTLLRERFHLAVHRETRDISGYWLVIGKNGLKMERVPDSDTLRAGSNYGNGEIIGVRQPMAQLARNLSAYIHVPVIDKTDLKGRYNFSLRWASDEPPATPDNGVILSPELERPSLFGAIQELGLRLERHAVPLEIIVVEHAEKPAEN
jgi:uncharacterized protein (TIGR03435 family)